MTRQGRIHQDAAEFYQRLQKEKNASRRRVTVERVPVDDGEDEWLIIRFEKKAALNVRTALKLSGFRWCPDSETWQGYASALPVAMEEYLEPT